MAYYDEHLRELQQQIGRKNRLDCMIKELNAQRKELEEKVRELEASMHSEQADVEKLEHRSLANFFYNVVGKMDEKLDKERAEAYAAKVKYDAAVKELADVQRDIESYQKGLRVYEGCEERYAQLLRDKEHEIKVAGGEAAEEIFKLEKRLSYLEGQKKELTEAEQIGEAALKAAEEVLESLKSAEDWGTWDLLGGGLVVDIIKHDHLDTAQESIERLQGLLRCFKTELVDVTIDTELQINVDEFLRFADTFFDGLFADWAVLDKIHKSEEQMKETVRQVRTVLSQLYHMKKAAEDEQKELKSKRDALVRNTLV